MQGTHVQVQAPPANSVSCPESPGASQPRSHVSISPGTGCQNTELSAGLLRTESVDWPGGEPGWGTPLDVLITVCVWVYHLAGLGDVRPQNLTHHKTLIEAESFRDTVLRTDLDTSECTRQVFRALPRSGLYFEV